DLRRQQEILEAIELVTDIPKELLFRNIQNIPDAVIDDLSETNSTVKIPGQPLIKVHFTAIDNFIGTWFTTSAGPEFLTAFQEQYSFPKPLHDEAQLFHANGLAYIPPPLRETKNSLQRAAESTLPELIQPKDIKGIIHAHSTWSDGAHTLEQMAKAAKEKGFEYLVISDHSQAAYYAKGLKPEQIALQHAEVDALNRKLAPFKIFKSIEADILFDGSLDYNESILSTFDMVIASVHSNLRLNIDKAMSRMLKAIAHPFTSVLGHPTGMLLLSREGYPIDHKRIIDACAEHDVVIEINAHPRRLDLDWRWIDYALQKNLLLSIDPDAHAI